MERRQIYNFKYDFQLIVTCKNIYYFYHTQANYIYHNQSEKQANIFNHNNCTFSTCRM